jgi:hypothetical protein
MIVDRRRLFRNRMIVAGGFALVGVLSLAFSLFLFRDLAVALAGALALTASAFAFCVTIRSDRMGTKR